MTCSVVIQSTGHFPIQSTGHFTGRITMLVPVFTLKLSHKINPKQVAIGKYDGKRPCLTGATTGGKIFIHNPSNRGQKGGGRLELAGQGDLSLLNINQVISAVKAGQLDRSSNQDILVVGTQTNILAFDVTNNKDIFFKEVGDGANAITIGKLGTIEAPLAIVGGNCSIQGYDANGNDLFWTVTGDNVCSLALVDFNCDNNLELLVGSEDFDIRVFREDEIIAEMTETEAITLLCPMNSLGHFGYALANATVGVYDRNSRNWRIKSKNLPMAIHSFDLDGDGVDELVTGWSNGKLDVRNSTSGEIIFKDNFNQAIAGIVQGDYRQDGNELLIFCTVEGDVRGFSAAGHETKGSLMDANVEQDLLRELNQKKQNLLMELKNYEENQRAAQMDRPSGMGEYDRQQMGVIPANTQVQSSLYVTKPDKSDTKPSVELFISTTNDTVARAVIVFGEGIFDGESHCVHPALGDVSDSIRCPLYPAKDLPVDLYIKIFVGYKTSTQFHVFEMTRTLPRYSMYLLNSDNTLLEPKSYVAFQISERINRVVMWLNQNFLLTDDLKVDGNKLDVRFLSLRSMRPVFIQMEANGQVHIRTDDMELAGDLVQQLCGFLNIEELASTAEFPDEMEKLKEVLGQVDDFQNTRQKLSAQMADHSNIIRSLVVRSEDARILGDMRSMRQGYQELFNLNRDLLNGYRIRSNNHQELLNCLKKVNQTIQRAGQLRLGKYKTQVISSCREAVKSNSSSLLLKIIKTGSA